MLSGEGVQGLLDDANHGPGLVSLLIEGAPNSSYSYTLQYKPIYSDIKGVGAVGRGGAGTSGRRQALGAAGRQQSRSRSC